MQDDSGDMIELLAANISRLVPRLKAVHAAGDRLRRSEHGAVQVDVAIGLYEALEVATTNDASGSAVTGASLAAEPESIPPVESDRTTDQETGGPCPRASVISTVVFIFGCLFQLQLAREPR